MTNDSTPIGEVIESNTSMLIAEVLPNANAPALGMWMRIDSADGLSLLGVVCHVEQGSRMPRRQVMAFGKTNEELRKEMPHVMAMRRTAFKVSLVAYRTHDGRVRQTLPPHPAGLNDFVSVCTDIDIRQIAAPYDFLRTLLAQPDSSISIDDLIAALLRQMCEALDPEARRKTLLEAGKTLSRLMRDDHERLQAVLRRI